jgi:ABC-type lipopolysaccharide export system ATPase subunit
MMAIGMIGTLLGFIMVLSTAFADVDTSSIESMKNVISTLSGGMGIALITSLTGLTSSLLLKFQLTVLERENAK